MNLRSFVSATCLLLSVAMLVTGCATPPPPPPPVYMTASSTPSELSVNVVGTASTEASRPMLDAFATAVRNELQQRGYWLDVDAPEVLVELSVGERVLDRTGKNVILAGDFSLAATVPVRHNLVLGKETYSLQSEQSLGEEAARSKLVLLALPRAHRWIGDHAQPDDTGLAAVIVHVKGAELDPSEDRQVLGDFIQVVRETDGVQLIREMSRDEQTRSYKFRVVYAKGKFPPGRFLETVLAAHPELRLTFVK